MNLVPRSLQSTLLKAARQYPVVSLTGPRQSGKTTLARMAFPEHAYVTLEDPDTRAFAQEDPRGFLGQFDGPAILDEVQRTPDLFSYLQGIVDESGAPGQFILTGSQNFLLMEKISQSLAGRTSVLHLLPFSRAELQQRRPLLPGEVGTRLPKHDEETVHWTEALFRGFYPRVHQHDLDPSEWYRNYGLTYLERDVRQLVNVGDIETFDRFVRLLAGRTGQLLNLTSLGNDAGVSHTTAKRWLSILEASLLVVLLRPHHRNFQKRLVKTPKAYFLDSGLACSLLRIRNPQELLLHPQRGGIFEGFVVAEFIKNTYHRGEQPALNFWRDSTGTEIDVIVDEPRSPRAAEIKSAETVDSSFFDGLRKWRVMLQDLKAPAALIYGGSKSYRRQDVCVTSWSAL